MATFASDAEHQISMRYLEYGQKLAAEQRVNAAESRHAQEMAMHYGAIKRVRYYDTAMRQLFWAKYHELGGCGGH